MPYPKEFALVNDSMIFILLLLLFKFKQKFNTTGHTTGHTIDFKSTHILSSLTKSSQLDLTEHAAIKIICPSLNKLHSAPNINNQWTDLLPTIKNSFRPRLAYPP